MLEHLSTPLIFALCLLSVGLTAVVFWYFTKPKIQKPQKLIKRHLYEGPPEPCMAWLSDNTGSYVIRSLITDKERILHYLAHPHDVGNIFLAYGYAFAEIDLNGKIRFTGLLRPD